MSITELIKDRSNIDKVLDSCINGISLADPHQADCPIVYVNAAFESLTGYRSNEVIGKNCRFLQGNDKDQNNIARIRQALFENRPISCELRNYRKNGEHFYNQLSISPIFNERGECIYFMGIQYDITKQVIAAQKESTSRRQLQSVMDASTQIVIIATDPQGHITLINAGTERMLGYAPSELIGKDMMTVIRLKSELARHDTGLSPETGFALRTFDALAEFTRQGQHNDLEWTLACKDGSSVLVELAITAVHSEALVITGYLCVASDISKRKQMERLKNEFISTVSHELRTPLTSIRGSLGLMAGGIEKDLPPVARRMIDIAYKNSESLMLLVNDLLDMEKIESGKMTFDLRSHSLMDIVEQTVMADQGYAQQFETRLEITRSIDATVEILVDATRLTQTLSNLISNACKFSPQGEMVQVAVTEETSGVRVSVMDQGPGIAAEFQPRIFEKFSQADASDSRKMGGSGLGLSISKSMIEAMGGRIGFETKAGAGTKFWIEFPPLRP